ncbi:hypothetical protein PtB15_2B794 [Puccinia triticina]|nr:hypothetical protein PtB15_2B794 [Puccinia triticina]
MSFSEVHPTTISAAAHPGARELVGPTDSNRQASEKPFAVVCVGIGPKVSVSMSVEGPSGGVSAGKSVIAQVTGEGVMNNPTGCGLTPDGELLSAANAQPLHAHEAVIPHDEAPVAVAPPGQSPDQEYLMDSSKKIFLNTPLIFWTCLFTGWLHVFLAILSKKLPEWKAIDDFL